MSYLSDAWNHAVSILYSFYGQQKLASGTCFFWSHQERVYLVTNWHNLAGRNHLTGENLSPHGGRPDRVFVMVYRKTGDPLPQGVPSDVYSMEYVGLEIKLCEPDFSLVRWFQHPTLGRLVDVGAIDVTELAVGMEIRAANVVEADAVVDLKVAQDVFVVGFPYGAMNGLPAPIWKRGSIASDPAFKIDGMPKLVIDTATREGMSGSPVVARSIVLGGYKTKAGLTKSVVYARIDTVMGIYSGRHYPDLEKAQLGIVWNRDAIEETVASRQVAVLPL